MIWRWTIRGLGIALLTLCVTAWVGSYFEILGCFYGGKVHNWDARLRGGELHSTDFYHLPREIYGWDLWLRRYDGELHAADKDAFEAIARRFLGFAWRSYTGPDFTRRVMFPLWFPTLLSAGCLWLVWRKTRPKYSGKGFPVEVAGGGGKEATKA